MSRRGRLPEGLAISFPLLGGPLAALFLALAEYARYASLLAALTLAAAGYLLLRLAERRRRNGHLRGLRREIRDERRAGRMCLLLGAALVPLALILPPWASVPLGLLAAILGAVRGLAVVGDSANRERELEIGNLSPAAECPQLGIWAQRVATLPGCLPKRVGGIANNVPPSGTIRGARLATLALAAGAILAYGGIASALFYKEADSSKHDHGAEQRTEVEDEKEPKGAAPARPDRVWSDPTYEDECPKLPDPLAIGHGLGRMFHLDGAFKAGCGSKAWQVIQTGAWVSEGICDERLRSVAVAGPKGEKKAILYGAAARFALAAAQHGQLVSAEGANPAGGDVYVVETLGGSYGFVRQAVPSESSAIRVRDCTAVTGTDQLFTELYPPMMLHWRDLVQHRGAWFWPSYASGPSTLVFTLHSSGEIAARGTCLSEFSCDLKVDGVTWPGEGTSFVSLDEFRPYLPPSEQ